MGNPSQRAFVERLRGELSPPFLEVGAKDYGTTEDLRSLFDDAAYVGVDLEEGPGVDVVVDLAGDFGAVDRALGGRRFDTVFCLSVLEHCADPFRMARNLTRLLSEGGKVVVSAPFAWIYHAYPGDYWRFTHEGIERLFPELDFAHPANHLAGIEAGDTFPLDADLGRLKLSGRWWRRQGRWGRGLSADLLGALGALGPLRWLTRHRHLLPMLMVNMVGVRREGAPGPEKTGHETSGHETSGDEAT